MSIAMKSIWLGTLAAVVLPAAASVSLPNRGTISSTNLGGGLSSGLYKVASSLSLGPADQGLSGFTVYDNETVCIYVPAGVTLNLRGGNATDDSYGAGAGIDLPEHSKLIFTGAGTVNIIGGDGGSGGAGGNGSNAKVVTVSSRFSVGAGGTGGRGGGGAGPAIGGRGGRGGSGGTGGGSRTYNYTIHEGVGAWDTFVDGNPGADGAEGQNGGTCGNLVVLGSVQLTLTSGQAGSKGAAGAAGDSVTGHGVEMKGGNGGLGGLGGYAPSKPFGRGGHGGCGGGGGGGGYPNADGLGTTDGSTLAWTGHGATSGEFWVSTNATVNLTGGGTMETTPELQVVISFLGNSVGSLNNAKVSATATYGLPFPNAPEVTDAGFLGWFTGPDGTGDKIYNADGTPVPTVMEQWTDFDLYPHFDRRYLPTGVYINNQEIGGSKAEGQEGPGWHFDSQESLVTLSQDMTYRIAGTNEWSSVHFAVATNAVLELENLNLVSTNGVRGGIVSVAEACAADIKLLGTSVLDASNGAGLAGIFCPSGATVKVSSEATRNLVWTEPENFSTMGTLGVNERDTKSLVVKGGSGAAAIGGRKNHAGGISGLITIDNCSIWADGGAKAHDVGPGELASGVSSNLCGSIHFLQHPNVRHAAQTSASLPRVYPPPQNEYESPLWAMEVFESWTDQASGSRRNVYWMPYGAISVQQPASGGGWQAYETRTIKHF